jgi:hypothetical protein
MIALPGPIRQVDRDKQGRLQPEQPHVSDHLAETISGKQWLSVRELKLDEPPDIDVDVR